MKTAARDIDRHRLLQAINAEYGFGLSTLEFIPKGEEAYAYIAQGHDGARFFVRSQPSARARSLEVAYAVTDALQRQLGPQIVSPYATTTGTFTVRYGKYTIAVFPFLEGSTLYEARVTDDSHWYSTTSTESDEQGVTDADLRAQAALLAALHESDTTQVDSALPRESFSNPFEGSILRLIAEAGAPSAGASPHQHEAKKLFRAERTDILATLAKMSQMQSEAQQLAGEWVITHGDPNEDNFLKGKDSTLYLTDWGEVALGPPERDLSAFTGARFERFLRHYANARGAALTLHPARFAFYFYRWTMQEIADYGTRILFQQGETVEEEHAWAELQPYLPIRHSEIARGVQAVQAVLDHVL
jgi:aminoglycoside phosphotransferase (APT) family kinase protein